MQIPPISNTTSMYGDNSGIPIQVQQELANLINQIQSNVQEIGQTTNSAQIQALEKNIQTACQQMSQLISTLPPQDQATLNMDMNNAEATISQYASAQSNGQNPSPTSAENALSRLWKDACPSIPPSSFQ